LQIQLYLADKDGCKLVDESGYTEFNKSVS